MMRKVYRLTKSIHANDLSGTGASLFGGRWNPKGVFVLYTASTASLAMLEWLAHAHERTMDESYSLETILIPKNSIEILQPDELPATWKKVPPPATLAAIGRKFVDASNALALEVPSVLVPFDCILVINTQHPLMQQVRIEYIEQIDFDRRLF